MGYARRRLGGRGRSAERIRLLNQRTMSSKDMVLVTDARIMSSAAPIVAVGWPVNGGLDQTEIPDAMQAAKTKGSLVSLRASANVSR